MKNRTKVLDIFKGGLQDFVELAVKQHHEKLLGLLPDSNNSGFTRLQSCYECTRRNLKPRHSENECPSQNLCICKVRRRDKRHCQNEICDYIYEGIIKDHVKFSPNLKTTYISQWTQNYWEIAMCFMQHRSESAESTDLLDLLHLVSNNRFILKQFITDASVDSEKKEREIGSIVDKVITICRKVKQSAVNCSSQDIVNLCMLLSKINNRNACTTIGELKRIAKSLSGNGNKDCQTESDVYSECVTNEHASTLAGDDTTLQLTDEKLRQAVTAYIQSADNALKCKGNENKHIPLEIFIEHKVDICGNSEKEGFLERSLTTTVFGENKPKKYIVTKAEDDYKRNDGSSRWDEYEWFTYNCLKHFSESNKKAESKCGHSLYSKQAIKFSNVYVVSKAFAKRVQLPLKLFSEYVRKRAKMEKVRCLIILDFRDQDVLKLFQDDDDDVFEKHTVVKIADGNLERVQSSYIVLTLHSKAKLTIRKESSGVIHNRSGAKLIQKCLHKCKKKLGPENISKITFENIRFDDPSTKIKISTIPKLETLILKSCSFTPDFPSSLVFVEVEDEERRLSHYLNQLNIIFPTAIKKCQYFEYIRSAGLKIGNNELCIKLKKSCMETNAKNYYGKILIECDKNQILELLHFETLKILGSTSCDLHDFEQTKQEDRKAVLAGVCYGLRESDENLVHVYAAEFYENKESTKLVLVCYMRETFDVDEECVWGIHRGFTTFTKSYYHVCPKMPHKKFDGNEIRLDDYFENSYRNINETINEHSKQLMEAHSNLEVIGINLGEAVIKKDGPYIALYIRSKSFVPYGENLFPTELTHPTNREISFKTVVREDFFVPLPDSLATPLNALEKVGYLAMGCSIGFEGNTSGASLGPFVEYQLDGEMKNGFLTACHLFSLPENADNSKNIGIRVVQPSESDVFIDIKQPFQETSTSSVCGFTIANVFDQEVDASLVKITDRAPDTDRFINCHEQNISDAGISSELGMPTYKDGSIKDLDECVGKKVVKFGKTTNLTAGRCLTSGAAVRVSDFRNHTVTCPNTLETRSHCMIQQFQIQGISRHKGDSGAEEIRGHFCDKGDSGAGIFLVNDDISLSCVGIVIGRVEGDGTCIATPITTVLNKLSRAHGYDVTLKKFS